jgi:NitT/TauT family transport system substrate-binding protein
MVTWPGFGAVQIAKVKGFFGDLPVEASIIDDVPALKNSFISGRIDISTGAVDVFAQWMATGANGVIFLVTDRSDGGDAIVVNGSIQSAWDLKGKKIALVPGDCATFILSEYLKQNGMSLKDVERVPVDDASKGGQIMLSGTIDGTGTWEPFISQIVASGKGRVLVSTKNLPIILDVMIARQELVSQRKEDLRKFTQGVIDAVRFAQANPVEADQILSAFFKIPVDDLPKMRRNYIWGDLELNKKWLLPKGGSKAEELFGKASALWLEDKIISTPVPAASAFSTEFIENVR